MRTQFSVRFKKSEVNVNTAQGDMPCAVLYNPSDTRGLYHERQCVAASKVYITRDDALPRSCFSLRSATHTHTAPQVFTANDDA